MGSKSYKYCAVPLCHNTTIKTPQKLFIYVPTQKERRKEWFRLARRGKAPVGRNIYYCEDHFDVSYFYVTVWYINSLRLKNLCVFN